MRTLLVVLLLALPSLAQQDPSEGVRLAETGFAKAFADRDKDRFFSYVADDATFLSGLGTLRGKARVIQGWSRLLESPQAPFSWGPERVHVSADGKLGFSHGPLYDQQGKLAGHYTSMWRRESDGTWKVVFDGPGAAAVYKPDVEPKVEEGFVTTADGVRLHFRKSGASPVTVIVPLEFVLWDDVQQLTEIATVIAYDLRNRGRSSRSADKSTWTIEQDVKDLETIRNHFKVEKFVPIGFSYLGKMVVLYAREYPDRVTRIIQLGPAEMTSDVHASARRQLDFTAMGVPAADLQALKDANARGDVEKSPREQCEALWKVLRYMLVGDPRRATLVDTSFCALENEWSKNFGPHVTSILDSMKKVPLTKADVAKVTVPVLTIHGTEDRNAPYEGGKEWAASLPDARLLTVKGAAHNAWIDDPIVVFTSIREFLRGTWPYGAVRPGSI